MLAEIARHKFSPLAGRAKAREVHRNGREWRSAKTHQSGSCTEPVWGHNPWSLIAIKSEAFAAKAVWDRDRACGGPREVWSTVMKHRGAAEALEARCPETGRGSALERSGRSRRKSWASAGGAVLFRDGQIVRTHPMRVMGAGFCLPMSKSAPRHDRARGL